jgi:hypothetical protein
MKTNEKDEKNKVIDQDTELVEDELDTVAAGLNPQPEPPARHRLATSEPDLDVAAGRTRRRFTP